MHCALSPQLSVITGCMFSGKTDELIRQLRRSKIAGLDIIIFKPAKDTRTKQEIRSRDGDILEAREVESANDILKHVEDRHAVIGIDEAQFFSPDLVPVVNQLLAKNKQVVAAGLDLDFRGEPFKVMADLMARAHPVLKLTAVCMRCRAREATRSQRLSDAKDREVIGDREYEPRCLICFEV